MKRLLFAILSIGAVFGGSASALPPHSQSDEIAATFYTNQCRRPFSWYYPNSYQYYYPKHRKSGTWNYTNGSYIYTNK